MKHADFIGTTLLQWGRDLVVADTVRRGYALTYRSELQWGRDLVVADTRASTLNDEKPSRFNGAAT